MHEWRRCPITGIRFEVVQIGYPRDHAPITRQIGARRTNQNREFFVLTIKDVIGRVTKPL